EREVDAALGLGAGGCDRPRELRQVAELDDVGGLRAGGERKQHGGGEGYASHQCSSLIACSSANSQFSPAFLPRHPEVRAQRASKGGGPGRASFEARLWRAPQDDG